MKKVFILLGFIAFGINLHAQVPIIKNASFENWTDIGGYLYPNDCSLVDSNAVQAGVLTRQSGGTNGSYCLHLGTFIYNSKLNGADISIYDTLTDRIGGILFDYKVQNKSNAWLSGLLLHIYFYDSANFIGDYSWSSPDFTSNSTFVPGNFSSIICTKSARYYLLTIAYINMQGSTVDYAEIDNLRFTKNTSINDYKTKNNISLIPYPNPTSNSFSLQGLNTNDIGALYLVDVNGKQYKLKVATNMDVSAIPNGIYLLKIFNRSNELIQSTKFAILK